MSNPLSKTEKILMWMIRGETGTSSMVMAVVALGLRDPATQDFALNYRWHAPYDPSDFNRCYKLVKEVPEIREDFEAIGQACPAFKPILAQWDELVKIHERDLPTGKSHELYNHLKEM